MTKKSGKIGSIIAKFQGQTLDAHYLGYFDCFNRQLFFEAHDVLEQLWLADRHGPDGPFYKGLIQLAGAFVHLQKNRLQPATALFKLAEANLQPYLPAHLELNVDHVLALIRDWLQQMEHKDVKTNPLTPDQAPELKLETGSSNPPKPFLD